MGASSEEQHAARRVEVARNEHVHRRRPGLARKRRRRRQVRWFERVRRLFLVADAHLVAIRVGVVLYHARLEPVQLLSVSFGAQILHAHLVSTREQSCLREKRSHAETATISVRQPCCDSCCGTGNTGFKVALAARTFP